MFAAHFFAAWMRGHVVDDFAAQNNTSCGSSDTDVNELQAMPTGSSPSMRGDDRDAGREVAEDGADGRGVGRENLAVRRAHPGPGRTAGSSISRPS